MTADIVSFNRRVNELHKSKVDEALERYHALITKKLELPTPKLSKLDKEVYEWAERNPHVYSAHIVKKIVESILHYPTDSLDHSTLGLFISSIKKVPYGELTPLKERLCKELEVKSLEEIDIYHSPFIVQLLRQSIIVELL